MLAFAPIKRLDSSCVGRLSLPETVGSQSHQLVWFKPFCHLHSSAATQAPRSTVPRERQCTLKGAGIFPEV